METTLYRLTLTFRPDGAIDAVIVRRGRMRRRHEIYAHFGEYGWQQRGEPREILADNVCLMERILGILVEEQLS